jgi:hypothetical protein
MAKPGPKPTGQRFETLRVHASTADAITEIARLDKTTVADVVEKLFDKAKLERLLLTSRKREGERLLELAATK